MSTEPTAINENITQEDIDAAATANRAILQERFPDYDISRGGPIDSVLVDGTSVITARNDADVDTAYLYAQLQAIADGTVTASDEDVDSLVANYFITRYADTPASGTVVFVVRDNITYTFQAGYRLRTADQTYQLTASYNVYPVGTTNVDFTNPRNVLLQQVYDFETGFQYRFELPIESLLATPDAVLVSGDRLTVDQSFDGLGYVEANTNFQGGIAAETNAEVVSRALQGITALTLGGQDNIAAIAAATVQRASSYAIGAGDPMMTRDRNNVFNISTGGKVDIYVKSGAIAEASYQDVTGVVQSVLQRRVRITLTREQSAGVYRQGVIPLYVGTPPTVVSGAITIQSITHVAWTDSSGFNPEMPDSYDRAFSARQQIQIEFIDDRQDSGGYVVDINAFNQQLASTYQVTTEYQPGTLEQDTAMMSYRPPGTDALVKSAVPCIVSIGLVAQKPTEYNGPDGESLAASLATEINLLPIQTEFIDNLSIAALLRSIEPSLTVVSVSLAGTIYGQNDTDIAVVPTANRLIIPTNATAKVSPNNTYFTTTSALVTVNLV